MMLAGYGINMGDRTGLQTAFCYCNYNLGTQDVALVPMFHIQPLKPLKPKLVA